MSNVRHRLASMGLHSARDQDPIFGTGDLAGYEDEAPAFVATERGSFRVPTLLSSKNSIVVFGT